MVFCVVEWRQLSHLYSIEIQLQKPLSGLQVVFWGHHCAKDVPTSVSVHAHLPGQLHQLVAELGLRLTLSSVCRGRLLWLRALPSPSWAHYPPTTGTLRFQKNLSFLRSSFHFISISIETLNNPWFSEHFFISLIHLTFCYAQYHYSNSLCFVL